MSSEAPGRDRRTLVRNLCLTQFGVGYVCSVAIWFARTDHHLRGLITVGLPVACATAFLVALAVGFPTLCPWPRLRPVTAVTMPAMYCALLFTVTALLTSRRSAQMEPNLAQREMQTWLEPTFLAILFATQMVLFLLACVMLRPSEAEAEESC